jgi:hypothetical protein
LKKKNFGVCFFTEELKSMRIDEAINDNADSGTNAYRTQALGLWCPSRSCGRQKDRNYNKQRPTTYFGWRRFIGRCSDFIFIIFLFVHVLPCFFANRRFFGANRARCLRARCLGLGARVARGAERPTGNLPDARSHRFTGR